MPAYTLNQPERQYADVARRYPNATLPLDFAKLVCSWMQVEHFPFRLSTHASKRNRDDVAKSCNADVRRLPGTDTGLFCLHCTRHLWWIFLSAMDCNTEFKIRSFVLQEPTDDTQSLGCALMPLDRPVAFEHEVDFEPAPPLRLHHRPSGGVHYTVKVGTLAIFTSHECIFQSNV